MGDAKQDGATPAPIPVTACQLVAATAANPTTPGCDAAGSCGNSAVTVGLVDCIHPWKSSAMACATCPRRKRRKPKPKPRSTPAADQHAVASASDGGSGVVTAAL